MKTVVETQYILEVKKVIKTTDLRFKTGYREITTLARHFEILNPQPQPGFNEKTAGSTFNYLDIFKFDGVFKHSVTQGYLTLTTTESEKVIE